jgi:hypothetical protein
MTMRRFGGLGLTIFAGLLSCAVALYGLRASRAIDFRQDPALSVLYCVLPLLSLPLYLLALVVRRLAPLQVLIAVAYSAVYSALNWRTCAAWGTCGTVAAVVFTTLKAPSMLAFFGVAICSLGAFALDRRPAQRVPSKD